MFLELADAWSGCSAVLKKPRGGLAELPDHFDASPTSDGAGGREEQVHVPVPLYELWCQGVQLGELRQRGGLPIVRVAARGRRGRTGPGAGPFSSEGATDCGRA